MAGAGADQKTVCLFDAISCLRDRRVKVVKV
jgi:hypothetical protein